MKKGKISVMLLAVVLLVVLLVVLPTYTGAVSFTLSRVADTNTAIPGGTGNFACRLGPYSISGNNVVFRGTGFRPPFFCEPSGIYHFDGTTLSKVADTNTVIPGGVGNFTEFGSPPFFDSPPLTSGNNVVFEAVGSGGQQGIYLFDGSTLSKVADTNTPIPGGTGNFSSFSVFSISGGNIAFFGSGSGEGGIYLFNGATLTKVADGNTPIPPGGAGNFDGFLSDVGSVAISGSNVVFDGFGSSFGQEGIYLFEGVTLRKAADTNTAFPGGTGNFHSFGSVAISASNVAFRGGSGFQQGVYVFDGTTLGKVADTNTPIPGGTGDFCDFRFPVLIGGGNVAFMGVSGTQQQGFCSRQQGIYLFDGTVLSRLADTKTMVPGGKGDFTDFFGLAMSDRNVAFGGFGSLDEQGIYFFNGTTLSVVADTNTPIPGGTGNFGGFSSPPVISDSNMAFAAAGFDGTQGIYLASHESISPAKVWVGLKNSDDVGLRVDVLAEVFKNDTLLASGQLNNQSTGSSGFNNALLKTVVLSLSLTGEPVEFASEDTLRMRLSVRKTCSGGGHNSGTVRLWYGGAPIDSGKKREAGSRFDATIASVDNDYFLRGGFDLNVGPGSSRLFIDVFVDSKAVCPNRPFSPFGTWTIVLP